MSYPKIGNTVNGIGKTLRDARVREGLTIREVGRRVNAHEAQISNWERGVNEPGAATLRKYVAAGLITAEQALGVTGEAA